MSIVSGQGTNSITVNINVANITADITGTINATPSASTGCTGASVSISVTAKKSPTATVTASGSTAFCSGGSVTLNASAGSSYLWSNGQTTASIVVNASGNFNYTVTAANGCSANSTVTTVSVTPINTIALSSAAGTDAQTVLLNSTIANITYTTTGATGASVSGLPTGVNAVLTGNSLVISGTASESGTYNYTINLTGGCGTITQNGSITVNQPAAIANCPFTGYQQFFASATNCSAIATYSPTFTGFPAPQVTYTFTGATIGSGTGTGSGSAFNVGKTTVTITATNSVNSSICSFDITVIDNNPPTAITKNITVYLNALGQATIVPADVNNGSNDNCGTVTLSLQNTGKICGTGNEGNNVTLTAPTGAVFTSIDFASYGTPNGSCGNFTIGNCNAGNSVSVASSYLLGKNTGTVQALNSVFGDPCGGTVKRLYIQASFKGGASPTNIFNCSNLGNNTVNLIVTDANGNASIATATVLVKDIIAPTITAPSNISVIATSSLGAIVNYTAPVGTDNTNCVTTTRTAGLPSGSRFPIGTTTVTYTATDAAGNSTPATFTVTVSGLAPVIVIPQNSSVNTDLNSCGAVVHFAATETTAIPASVITYKENGNAIASGATLAPGLHTITATATNAVGTSIGTFTITVTDNQFPAITAPSNISLLATDASGAVATYTVPVGTDNCSVTTSMIAGLASGSTFPIGTTTVTYRATDASGNSTDASFTVTVTGLAPVIVTPGDIVVNNDPGMNGAVVNFAATETTAIPASTITYTTAPGSFFTVGTHTVTATATNAVGSSSVDFNVIVVDHEKPTIATAADIAVNNDENACAAIVTTTAPAASDNTSIESVTGVRADGLLLTDAYPVGSTVITWTAKDVNGNSNSSTQTITVTDNQLPTITAPASVTVTANAGLCAASNVNLGLPVTSDNCAVATVTNDAPASFFVGATTVTWTVTDIHGNVSTATQIVTVTDDELPVIVNTPINITQSNDQGNCGAIVSWTAATATDNCPGVTISSDHQSGEIFPVGTTTVTYTATDAHGHTVTSSFTITVNDTELPTVLTQAKTIYLDASGHANISVADINHGSTDNCAIDQITLDKTAFDCSNLGANTVNLTVTDIHGNVNSAIAIVTVKDEIAPILSAAPADAIVECNAVTHAAVLTATDNCSATVIFTETRTNGKSSNDYTLTRTWTATDAAGNSVSKTQTITVQDTKAPILSVPTNISVNTDNNVCGATITFAATATDNCATPVITYSQNPNTVFPVGTTTVRVTATDASGNTSTGSFTITVKDKQAPIALAKNITIGLSAVGGTATINGADVNNGSNDACGIASMTVVPASFSCANIGANRVTLTVTDVNGNVSTTTATVTVVDDKGPVPSVITLPTISGQCYATVLTMKAGEHEEDHDGDDNRIDLEHYTLIAPTAMDNCSGLIKGTTTDALTYYNQGTYTIHWKYVDAKGNVTIQEQTVIVKDTQAPTPKRATLPTLTGQCSVSVASGSNSDDDGDDNDGGDDDHGKTPWAKDNCSGWIKGTTTSPLTYSAQGTYTITWNFDDGHGNISHQTQTVIVKDITKPKINAPKDKSIACGSSILPAVTGMATATDNCSTPVITFTDVNANNLITRTWTATDAAGNTSTDVQLIKLTPAFTAVAKSTPTSTVYTGGSTTNIYLGYGAQSTTLSVSGLPAGNYTYTWSGASLSGNTTATPVFNATVTGVFTFYVTVSNASGCSSTASISICVTDVRVPGSNGTLIYVCHQGTNKTGGTQTLSVPVAQVAAHLANTCGGKGGDKLGSCSSTACTTNNETSAIDPKATDLIELKTIKADATSAAPVDDIKVTVMPNPSTTYFTLKLESKDTKTLMSIRVTDASGRAIEAKQQIEPNSNVQIGFNYPSGTFFTEVMQGTKRKTVQLIKARG
jgi:hypothetical protein